MVLAFYAKPRYDHFFKLTEGEHRFLVHHYGSDIPNNSCLCRAHSKEAKQHRSDPEYNPVWKRTHTAVTAMSCMYQGCPATNHCSRIIVPSTETLPIFRNALNIEGSVSLCTISLSIGSYTSPCAGCGAHPKSKEKYFRHSPDAVTVSLYLQNDVMNVEKLLQDRALLLPHAVSVFL